MQLDGKQLDLLFGTFFEITSLIHAGRERPAIFARVLDCCATLLGADTVVLALEQDGALHKFWKRAQDDSGMQTGELPGTPALLAWLERERRPFLAAPGRWRLPAPPDSVQRGAGSLVCAPLVAKESPLGLLVAWREAGPDGFDAMHLKILTALANQTAIAIENADLYARLKQEAVTDGLTGIYNYRTLMQALAAELRRAQRYSHPVSFIMADVDYLKSYNSRFGHLAGSDVLAQVAQRLVNSCRNTDVVGKYGGDEFAIILPQTGLPGARAVAERMRAAIAAQGFRHVRPGDITCSFGIACFPEDGREAFELIRSADQALFEAKSAGKNTLRSRLGASAEEPAQDSSEAGGDLAAMAVDGKAGPASSGPRPDGPNLSAATPK